MHAILLLRCIELMSSTRAQQGTGQKAAEPAVIDEAAQAPTTEPQEEATDASEAREWINAWRRRSLEKNLQKDASVEA